MLAFLLIPAGRARADQDSGNWVEVRSAHFIIASNGSEKDARSLSDQFEQIRNAFQTFLGFKKVDPPQPIVILAVKDERSMSTLLPDYWSVRGRVHPAGLFVHSEDANFILERMDSEGDNPYHVLYHEYTHAIVRLNFNYLPPWLNEGYAEFIGNTAFHGKSIEIGLPAPGDLLLLSQTRLLPLDDLFQVTEQSNYYNETNLANIFYAESWALVHYLMMDPTQRKAHALDRYVQYLAEGANPLDAAKVAFGDLVQLQQNLQKYVEQQSYFHIEIKLEEKAAGAQAEARPMTLGEVEAVEAQMEYSRGKSDLAKPLAESASKDASQLASPFVTLGMILYRAGDRSGALDNFSRAISLDTSSYLAYFARATLELSSSGGNAQLISDLEKSISLNPQFAPAYSLLSQAYIRQPDTRDKALAPAQTAVQLEPGNFAYQINLGFLFADMDRLDDARALAHRIEVGAKNDGERTAAQNLETLITQRADYEQQVKNRQQPTSATTTPGDSSDSAGQPALQHGENQGGAVPASEQPEVPAKSGAYAIGTVVSVLCTGTELRLELDVLNIHFRYHAADAGKIVYLDAQGNPDTAHRACSSLRGLQIKLEYQPVNGQDWEGEILSIRQMK